MNRLLSLLGLAQKAGKLATGELACEQAVRSGEAVMVLLSADASPSTVKKFSNRCFYYQVPLYRTESSKEEIGRAIGKGYRSCLAVTEPGFAANIQSITQQVEL